MLSISYKRLLRPYTFFSVAALCSLCAWYSLYLYTYASYAPSLGYSLGWFLAYMCGGAAWLLPFISAYTIPVMHDRRYGIAGFSIALTFFMAMSYIISYDPLTRTSAGGVLGHMVSAGLLLCMAPSTLLVLCWAALVFGVYLMVGHAWVAVLLARLAQKNSSTQPVVEPVYQESDAVVDMVHRTKPEPEFEPSTHTPEYPFPSIPKTEPLSAEHESHQEHAYEKARILEEKLARFGIRGQVVSVTIGPVVTLFEYQPHIDSRISKILAREDDLALALQAVSLRIIAPMPGKSVVGFEVAQEHRSVVLFNQLYQQVKHTQAWLPLVLGQNTVGATVIADLASMPHILVAGATGSGKSVALNTMLVSLLCALKPDDMRVIIIDPKKLDFAHYDAIPHLLFPVVTQAEQAVIVLRWAVKTMHERYERMSKVGVRSAREYHAVYGDMPSIVILIDEFSDLMMSAGKDIEDLIVRLAQMARAAGIHIILATQRPSVDVITGLIKANFPSRIAFKVTSRIDSRTILDIAGADKLLGKGDMLYLDNQGSITRIHGAYITDTELHTIIQQVKAYGPPVYEELAVADIQQGDALDQHDQKLFDDIVQFVQQHDEISISLLQRVFRIGYNRSARMMDTLEARGIILPADGGKMRKVLRMQRETFS